MMRQVNVFFQCIFHEFISDIILQIIFELICGALKVRMHNSSFVKNIVIMCGGQVDKHMNGL